jgi:hypothetical protein
LLRVGFWVHCTCVCLFLFYVCYYILFVEGIWRCIPCYAISSTAASVLYRVHGMISCSVGGFVVIIQVCFKWGGVPVCSMHLHSEAILCTLEWRLCWRLCFSCTSCSCLCFISRWEVLYFLLLLGGVHCLWEGPDFGSSPAFCMPAAALDSWSAACGWRLPSVSSTLEWSSIPSFFWVHFCVSWGCFGSLEWVGVYYLLLFRWAIFSVSSMHRPTFSVSCLSVSFCVYYICLTSLVCMPIQYINSLLLYFCCGCTFGCYLELEHYYILLVVFKFALERFFSSHASSCLWDGICCGDVLRCTVCHTAAFILPSRSFRWSWCPTLGVSSCLFCLALHICLEADGCTRL